VSVAADYETLDVVDGQVPHGLHNAELSLVAVPGMPQTNIQVVDDQSLHALMETHIKNGRAIVAPEAVEQTKDEATDFSKTPFRDVMRRFSRLP
jgi:5,10-methenyltetrahydromethanopterin hydrogenase